MSALQRGLEQGGGEVFRCLRRAGKKNYAATRLTHESIAAILATTEAQLDRVVCGSATLGKIVEYDEDEESVGSWMK